MTTTATATAPQLTDAEDILDDLASGGAPSDWLIATPASGPSYEMLRWAMDHAEARTEDLIADHQLVEHVLMIVEGIKAECIVAITEEITKIVEDAAFHLAALDINDEVVTIVLDGEDDVELMNEVAEDVAAVLNRYYAGHLDVEVVMIER